MFAARALALPLVFCFACAGVGGSLSEDEMKPDGPQPNRDGVNAPRSADLTEPPASPVAIDLPAGDPFPLTAGDTWHWQVVRRTGAGPRVLLMTSEPASQAVVADWTLTVGQPSTDGRFPTRFVRTPAGDGPELVTEFDLFDGPDGTLMMDDGQGPKPAFTLDAPPNPVSVEHVPCTAHLLGGFSGVCSPAPGGPLAIAPGPVRFVVSQDRDRGRALAQILVGIATVGTVIPGNKTSSESAALTAYTTSRTPYPIAPELAAFQRAPKLSTALADGPLDRETAAAMVALANDAEVVALAAILAPRLNQTDRWPLLRVAMQRQTSPRAQLAAIIALAQASTFADHPTLHASVSRLLPDAYQAAAVPLLNQQWPTLAAVVVAARSEMGPTLEAELRADHPIDLAQARTIVALFDAELAGGAVIAVQALVPHLQPVEADAIMHETLANSALFDARFELLANSPDWLAQQSSDKAARALLDVFSFDSDRGRVFGLLLPHAPAERHAPLLCVTVESMTFDDGKLKLLNEHPQLVAALSELERARVIAGVRFKKDEARAVLEAR